MSTAAPVTDRMLLSGDEAVALAAYQLGIQIGTGYPGTPSTEILEQLGELGGKAQWAPNEKVALEVGLGASYAGGAALVTMKHVGLNVAADPLFTAAYSDLAGPLVVVSADDPGMASSQNEQDNRRYAIAAGLPLLEPADAQEAYAHTLLAFALSHRWHIPVLLRLTTRVCHSQGVVRPRSDVTPFMPAEVYAADIHGRVMMPANARPAHRRLRKKLADIAAWNEREGPNHVIDGRRALGIITSGVSYAHVREAAPDASVLKLGCTYPLPLEMVRAFAAQHSRVLVVEEGDPVLVEQFRTAGIDVQGKDESYRFGELNVARVRGIVAGEPESEARPLPGKPPALCNACPHRVGFQLLHDLDCIVSGDIGCYTLGALPPYEAMDTCVCMGASIGVGLGLRHVLPPDEARRVVSVIGDSTFLHSGLTGLVEMVYNPPPTGHVVLILDNGTTAMTGLQEHPGTGRDLMHHRANKVDFEAVVRGIGIDHVVTIDPMREGQRLDAELRAALARDDLTVIIARRPCLLAAPKIVQFEKQQAAEAAQCAHAEVAHD